MTMLVSLVHHLRVNGAGTMKLKAKIHNKEESAEK